MQEVVDRSPHTLGVAGAAGDESELQGLQGVVGLARHGLRLRQGDERPRGLRSGPQGLAVEDVHGELGALPCLRELPPLVLHEGEQRNVTTRMMPGAPPLRAAASTGRRRPVEVALEVEGVTERHWAIA